MDNTENCDLAFHKFNTLTKPSARDYKELLQSYNDALRNDHYVAACVKEKKIGFFVDRTEALFDLMFQNIPAAVINIKTSVIRNCESYEGWKDDAAIARYLRECCRGNRSIDCNELLLHVQFVGEVGRRCVTFDWEKSKDIDILAVVKGSK